MPCIVKGCKHFMLIWVFFLFFSKIIRAICGIRVSFHKIV